MLLMTETNLDVFHAQLLTPQDAPAMDQLCAACGTTGGPDTAALLQTNAVLGDYAGTDTLQAAMAMLPMFGQSRLALALRAAGFGRTARALCWHRPPLPRSTCRCGAFWPWRWGWPNSAAPATISGPPCR